MACFVVPAAEAVITTIAAKAMKSKEISSENENAEVKLTFSAKLKWLNGMLWGGSALLAFEHLWHGELIPAFPFLTGDSAEVLSEMATVGVGMSALVTAVWFAMVGVSSAVEKRAKSAKTEEEVASE